MQRLSAKAKFNFINEKYCKYSHWKHKKVAKLLNFNYKNFFKKIIAIKILFQ